MGRPTYHWADVAPCSAGQKEQIQRGVDKEQVGMSEQGKDPGPGSAGPNTDPGQSGQVRQGSWYAGSTGQPVITDQRSAKLPTHPPPPPDPHTHTLTDFLPFLTD